MVARAGKEVQVDKRDEGGQKLQTSSYKINKSWRCNVQHGDYSQEHCIACLKVQGKS